MKMAKECHNRRSQSTNSINRNSKQRTVLIFQNNKKGKQPTLFLKRGDHNARRH